MTLFCFAKDFLSYLAAVLNGRRYGSDHQLAIGINGRKDHSLALDTHHLTRREIGDEEHLLTHEYRRIRIAHFSRIHRNYSAL